MLHIKFARTGPHLLRSSSMLKIPLPGALPRPPRSVVKVGLEATFIVIMKPSSRARLRAMLSKRHQPRSAQLKTQDVSIFMSHSRNQDHEKETLGDVGRNGGDCHLSCLAVSLALWDTKVIIPCRWSKGLKKRDYILLI